MGWERWEVNAFCPVGGELFRENSVSERADSRRGSETAKLWEEGSRGGQTGFLLLQMQRGMRRGFQNVPLPLLQWLAAVPVDTAQSIAVRREELGGVSRPLSHSAQPWSVGEGRFSRPFLISSIHAAPHSRAYGTGSQRPPLATRASSGEFGRPFSGV